MGLVCVRLHVVCLVCALDAEPERSLPGDRRTLPLGQLPREEERIAEGSTFRRSCVVRVAVLGDDMVSCEPLVKVQAGSRPAREPWCTSL